MAEEDTLLALIEIANNRINKLNEILKSINRLIEKDKKLISSNDINEFSNLIQSESWDSVYQIILDNVNKLEKLYDLSSYNLNEPSESIVSENYDFLDMIKINEKIIALRTENLIRFFEYNHQSFKEYGYSPQFNNEQIQFFCAYEKKNVLVSLKGNENKNTIQLVDIENHKTIPIFKDVNKIIYLTNGYFTKNIYAILDSNELICFKDNKIEFKKKFNDEKDMMKCLVEICENFLFIGNDNGFFIFDINKKERIPKFFDEKIQFNPKNLFFKDNYIFYGGKKRNDYKMYIIDSKEYSIVQKIYSYKSFIFCDETPFVCIYDDNKFMICEFIKDYKNFYKKEESENWPEDKRINSIIYKSKDELIFLLNNRIVELYRKNI